MKISQQGIDLIKHFEGFSDVPYICAGGKNTIGYGHVILPGEKYNSISMALGESILKADMEKFEAHVLSMVKVPMTQGQFDALVSFAFNCGPENLRKSTLLKKVNAGDPKGAQAEFGKWVFAAKVRLKGLERRRAAEARLFGGEAWQ